MSAFDPALMNTPKFQPSPWLPEPCPSGPDAPRLFCFASAGGSAEIYRPWQEYFGQSLQICPVELPGRGRRLGEPFSASLADAASQIAEAIREMANGPFALFGHSLGSILALETARLLESQSLPLTCLFVSSYGAPHRYREDKGLYLASNVALVDEMRRYGNTPEEVLANGEFLQYMLPILRDDYRLLETHICDPLPLLDASIRVCAGDAEPDVNAEALGWWKELTRASCTISIFPGDHFYFQSDREPLWRHISGQLRELGLIRQQGNF